MTVLTKTPTYQVPSALYSCCSEVCLVCLRTIAALKPKIVKLNSPVTSCAWTYGYNNIIRVHRDATTTIQDNHRNPSPLHGECVSHSSIILIAQQSSNDSTKLQH